MHSIRFPRIIPEALPFKILQSSMERKIFWIGLHGAWPAGGFPAAHLVGTGGHHSRASSSRGGLPTAAIGFETGKSSVAGGLRHRESAIRVAACTAR